MITDTEGWAIGCPKCGSSNLSKRGFRELANGDKKQRYNCSDCNWAGSGVEYADQDTIDKAAQQARKAQKYQDLNRVERKAFREHARVSNLFEAMNDKLVTTLESHKFKPTKKTKLKNTTGSVGLFHFSDLHFNELIQLDWNQYDFNIASKRIQKYVSQTIEQHKSRGVERAVILFGGDLLNSDRRMDEITCLHE